MWISYLRLKNYIGVKNGLHKNEVEIKFNIKNKITLFLGANGSGKSTIIHSLHPFSFGEEDKPSIIISGVEGEKEIHYVHNNNKYIIIHSYTPSKTGHNVKSYIRKASIDSENYSELNPNGNVTPFLEIVERELGISILYLRLSRLAINSNNIVNMTTAERKKYFNDIQPTLEKINETHKKLSEKVKVYKNLILKVSSNIDAIKDVPELQSRIKVIDNELNNYKTLKENLAEETHKESYKWEEYSRKLNTMGLSINFLPEEIDKLREAVQVANIQMTRLKSVLKNNGIDIENSETDLNKVLDIFRTKISEYNNAQDSINKDTEENNIKIGEINASLNMKIEDLENKSSKRNNIISNNEYNGLLNKKEELENSIKVNESKVQSSEFKDINNITSFEANNASINLKSISANVNNLSTNYAPTIVTKAIEKMNDDVIKEMNIMRAEMNDDIYNKNQLQYTLDMSMKTKDEQSKVLEKKPKDCNNSTCPFINIEKDKLITKEYLDNLGKQIKEYEVKIKEKERLCEELYEISNAKKIILHILDYIENNSTYIDKVYPNNFITNIDKFIDRLKNNLYSIEWDNSELVEYLTIKEMLEKDKKDLEFINSKLNTYVVQMEYVEELDKDISKLNDEITQARSKYNELLKKNESNAYRLIEIDKRKEAYNTLIEACSNYNANKTHIEEVKNKLSILEEIYEYKFEMEKAKMKRMKSLNSIDYNTEQLNDEKLDIEVNMRKLEEYKKEKEELEDNYNKLLLLKDVTSPNKGIPLVFIDIYMKRARTLANKLLQEILTDEYELLPFVINDKEFNIPCKKLNGVVNTDVKTMSMGEKAIISLILSVSLFAQGTTDYNIITIDEMDGPLDFNNKRKFLGVLENIMSIFDMEQVFVISHNNAFESYETNFILLNGAPKVKSSENVLYDNNNN